jgi:nucleoside-diphosphate-sugar epimerase
MQTILGAGGAIGTEVAKALSSYTNEIRLVSRNPSKVNSDDELLSADLLNNEQTQKAVEGSSVVYLTAGLPYKAKVWEVQWPKIMKNVIDACTLHSARLVFFDNMYMYDQDYLNGMDETTPVNPPSKKGKVRARIARMLLDKVDEGNITALIARCADYYGPSISSTSILTEMVFKNLAKEKSAFWFASDSCRHSFTFTPDAGRATALLGNTEDAFNQVWHLPTAAAPPSGKEWVEMIADELGVEARYRTLPKFLVRIMGLFVPIMRESVEMMYQYERDYVFDSSKFEKRFDFEPTPYLEGVRKVVATDYR